MILPYLNYCNLVWGSIYKTNLQRILSLQKRVIRIVDKSYYNVHTQPIFRKLNFLKFQDIHLMHLGQLCTRLRTVFSLENLFENIFSINNQTILTIQYHYVEQISRNSSYSIEVINFLILFHLRFRALHHSHFLGKKLKHYW